MRRCARASRRRVGLISRLGRIGSAGVRDVLFIFADKYFIL